MELIAPPPGEYQTPIMHLTRCKATKDPSIMRLEFQAERDGGKWTISVPITVLDAAGLLRSLLMLREQGHIPVVAEPNSPRRPT